MNYIYNTHFQAYYDKDLPVTPLIGKAPFLKNWNQIDSECPYKKGDNIGLILGKRSGVIALDIDTENIELQQQIKEVLPPIKCGKVGNRDRLPTIFFQYNGEKSQKIKGIIEILSDGNQTVLPPSIHPDKGYAYEWIGQKLLDINIEDLPVMTKELFDNLSRVLQSQVQASSFGGRHNTLVKIMGGKISDGLEASEIISECIQYDEIHHSPPYFSDKSEPHGGHGYASALSMLNSIVQTQARKGEIYKPAPRIKINLNERVEKPKFKKLPHLRGLGDDLFKSVYENSPTPRSQFSFASALNTLSMIIGTKARLSDNTMANIFQFLVAPSGFGKEHPERTSQNYLYDTGLIKSIGSSSPTSESLLYALFDSGREKCCYINEAEKTLKRLNDARSNHGLSESIALVYDKSGSILHPKQVLSANGNSKITEYGNVYSPYLNMYMVCTDTAFYDHMNTTLFNTGFGARFLYYFEDREKDEIELDDYSSPTKPEIVKKFQRIRNATPKWMNSFINVGETPQTQIEIPVVEFSECGLVAKKEIFQQCKKDKKKYNESNFKSAIKRKVIYVKKLALIDHVCLHQENYLNVPLTRDSLEWAYEAVSSIHHNMMIHIERSVSNSSYGNISNKIHTYVARRSKIGEGTPVRYIHTRFSDIDIQYRKKIIADLLEQGKLTKNQAGEFFV